MFIANIFKLLYPFHRSVYCCTFFYISFYNQVYIVSTSRNKIVEIDESKIAKRKYNKGHKVGAWVIGGIERSMLKNKIKNENKKMFLLPIPPILILLLLSSCLFFIYFLNVLLYDDTVFLLICKLDAMNDGAFPRKRYKVCNCIFNGKVNSLNIVPLSGDIAFLHL